MPVIRASSQGESRVRMLRIVRHGDRHDPHDLSVACRLEGQFDAAFEQGRAAGVLPGETLKNIVYRVAREQDTEEIERFGLALCDRLLGEYRQLTRVRVDIAEQRWARLEAGGKVQGQAFAAGSSERRTAAVTSNGARTAVVSGLEDLVLMRTSGFAPARPRDADASGRADGLQRLLVASLAARWTYATSEVTFASYRQGVRSTIVDTFVWHADRSVQHTLYNIADVVLASYHEITEISLALHERPYRPADLFDAGVENPDEVFVALDAPLGVVEVTVERE
jgi:urate oxidase